MLYYTGLLFLVIAVSLDGFGVGIAYGMQKIRMPLVPLFIIMCCSGVIVLLSMTIGHFLKHFISPGMASKFGACILIGIGLFSFINIVKQQRAEKQKTITKKKPERQQNFLQSLLNTPDKADLDKSGSISPKESLLLGTALAMDAFGAGLGAAIIGYTPFLTAGLIALMSGTFVYSGMKLGLLLSQSRHMQKMGVLPPLLLIALGIFNLF